MNTLLRNSRYPSISVGVTFPNRSFEKSRTCPDCSLFRIFPRTLIGASPPRRKRTRQGTTRHSLRNKGQPALGAGRLGSRQSQESGLALRESTPPRTPASSTEATSYQSRCSQGQ